MGSSWEKLSSSAYFVPNIFRFIIPSNETDILLQDMGTMLGFKCFNFSKENKVAMFGFLLLILFSNSAGYCFYMIDLI